MNCETPMLEEHDVRETPSSLFQPLNAEFGFTLDVCANASNAKCAHYFTKEGQFTHGEHTSFGGRDDGLTGSWKGHHVWCNPPYSDIAPWILKAWESNAHSVVMLVPATRCEQEWWQIGVEPYRDGKSGPDGSALHLTTRFLPGRQHFLDDGKPIYRRDKAGHLILSKKGKPQRSSPKFGCVLLIWR